MKAIGKHGMRLMLTFEDATFFKDEDTFFPEFIKATIEEKWLGQTGLNCRPLPCQGSALPLSYGPSNDRDNMGLIPVLVK